MLVGINVAMFQLKKNHSHHKFVLIGPTKSTSKQQPTISMGISKNPKPSKNREKMGGYESIPSMNHFGFMEIDDHVDFSYFELFCCII
jgi:hypothetical protein